MTIQKHSKERYLNNPNGEVDILDDPRDWNQEGQEEGADWFSYNTWEEQRSDREDIKAILIIQRYLITSAYELGNVVEALKKLST